MRLANGSRVQKCVDVINSLDDGEYLTTRQLAQRVGTTRGSILNIATRKPLCDMRVKGARNASLYVSDATMKAIRKENKK